MAGEKRRRGISRRGVIGVLAGGAVGYALGLTTPFAMAYWRERRWDLARRAVLPSEGIRAGFGFGNALSTLVDARVIDRDKFAAAYQSRGGVPDWVANALDGGEDEIVLSTETAPYLLNLLWPIGLANRMAANAESPLQDSTERYASTAGWVLGQAAKGADYFNSVPAVPLSGTQENVVVDLSSKIYRPCCNNSAFFQDCNHGSAMLGLIQLAVTKGLASDEIARLAKAINGFWYPQQYVEVAVHLEARDGTSWKEVEPRYVLGPAFSSATGWRRTHDRLIADGLIMESGRSAQTRCAV